MKGLQSILSSLDIDAQSLTTFREYTNLSHESMLSDAPSPREENQEGINGKKAIEVSGYSHG